MTNFREFAHNNVTGKYGKNNRLCEISLDILNIVEDWRVDNNDLYGKMSSSEVRHSATSYIRNRIDVSRYKKPRFLPPFVWQIIISQIISYILRLLIEKYITSH